jgi:4-carboxymuconolactone decarboxylase
MARLAAGEPLELEDPDEQAVHDVMRQLVLAGDLGDDAYAQAREKLGEQTLMELTTVAGYYAMLALQLRVFRVSPPET